MMPKMTPAAKGAILMAAFVCIAVWVVNFTGESHPTSDGETKVIPDQASEPAEPDPGAWDESLKGEKAHLEEGDRAFQDAFSRMRADSSLDALEPIRQDIDSFLADAEAIHKSMITDYRACIVASTDSTVGHNCTGPSMYMAVSAGYFGIEDTLRKYPNISRSQLIEDNSGWSKSLSVNLVSTKSTLNSMRRNPMLVQKSGVSVDDVAPIIDRAQQLEDRALSLGDEDPVLTWILQGHAELLLSDFNLRTFKYLGLLGAMCPNEDCRDSLNPG